jgi:hypothetical protein
MSPENFTAAALVVVNDVVRFFGGGDFLRGLNQNQAFVPDGLGDFLEQFNAELRRVPPGIAFVASYDRGSGSLVLRSVQ